MILYCAPKNLSGTFLCGFQWPSIIYYLAIWVGRQVWFGDKVQISLVLLDTESRTKTSQKDSSVCVTIQNWGCQFLKNPLHCYDVWIKPKSLNSDKPSLLWCVMTADITVYAESSGNNGCTPQLANWKPLTWTCTQMPQQDTSKNSYYMQV